jgi:hypothetical protein
MMNFVIFLAFMVCFGGYKGCNVAEADSRLWLDNGVVKVAIDKDYGGAIVWVSASESNENMINNADKGRQLQQSYYAGRSLDRQKEGQSSHWSPWSWNPVQAGNFKGDRSIVLDFELINDGKTLYSKTQPRLWDMDGELAKCYMYQWVEFEQGNENVIHVKNKLECFRDEQDIWDGPRPLSQELPAVYAIRNMGKMVIYDGSEPWHNKPLSRVKYTDKDNWIWTRQNPTEKWAACLFPDTNFGLGVYSPSADQAWNMGWVGEKGTEFSGATMHFAPIAKWELSHNTIKEFEYWIIVGKIDDIRRQVYRLHSEDK